MNKIIGITLLLLLILFALLFFLIKPYESFNEVRANTQPVTISVEYVNVTGDPDCAKLYMTEAAVGENSQQTAVFPALPDEIPSPDDGAYAYHGNRFELTGFRYEWVYTNKITGSKQHKKSRRFDVIKWKLIPPYSVWVTKAGDNDSPTVEKRHEPLFYEYSANEYPANDFKMDNYIDCLAQ